MKLQVDFNFCFALGRQVSFRHTAHGAAENMLCFSAVNFFAGLLPRAFLAASPTVGNCVSGSEKTSRFSERLNRFGRDADIIIELFQQLFL